MAIVFFQMEYQVRSEVPFVTSHVGDSGDSNPEINDKIGNVAEIHASVRQWQKAPNV